jgi:hypothetical protein
MNRLTNPPALNLSGEHNLFSSVRWQTNIFDGKFLRVRSGKDTGPERLEVLTIRPLHQIVAYDRTAGNGYYLTVTNETVDPRFRTQYRRSYFLKVNETNRNAPVIIREVQGPEESPSAFVLEFLETGERAVLETNKPAQRVLGYEADLRYPLEDKAFPKVRVDATIRFAGEDYKVVAITQNEVVITAPNGRQHRRQVNTVPGNASP